jgi:response regulator RpfG family c-di-GMP phosphodiesterase
MSIIREGSGIRFDPDVVEAFIDISDRLREVAEEYGDAGGSET